ncbi:hypothetical protein [Acidisphaera sp. L21]|jgi:hypothetical protein|uniref:hypothetical protein n=1 Tax=Acidisphaera sp. L21 TaxID=1641851 RepID=UPI00131DA0BB|nr:hypothetical protein [Acidisphaera sp. L21]
MSATARKIVDASGAASLTVIPVRSFAKARTEFTIAGGIPALPDLAALPAYIEPPRPVLKKRNRAGWISTSIVLFAALIVGVAFGLYIKDDKPIAKLDPWTVAVMHPPADPVIEEPPTSLHNVPLPAGVAIAPVVHPQHTTMAPPSHR